MPKKIVDWKEAGTMLAEGKNFAEIAEHFGVSRQCISQYYTKGNKGARKETYRDGIVYPNLRQWFLENRMTYRSFGAACFPDIKIQQAMMSVRRILAGVTNYFSLAQINAMSAVTGMTYEEMFQREEKQEAGNE